MEGQTLNVESWGEHIVLGLKKMNLLHLTIRV